VLPTVAAWSFRIDVCTMYRLHKKILAHYYTTQATIINLNYVESAGILSTLATARILQICSEERTHQYKIQANSDQFMYYIRHERISTVQPTILLLGKLGLIIRMV